MIKHFLKTYRLHLFCLKRLLGNYFTTLCVFGTYGKLGQTETALHVDYKKKPLFTHKTISALILPSIVLHFSHSPHTLLTHTHKHHTLSPSLAVTTYHERERELHPFPHANPSSKHSPTSATDPHTSAPVSFLHYLSPMTSPHL